jgi:hypothetical protein
MIILIALMVTGALGWVLSPLVGGSLRFIYTLFGLR